MRSHTVAGNNMRNVSRYQNGKSEVIYRRTDNGQNGKKKTDNNLQSATQKTNDLK